MKILTWKNDINLIENKISKSLGILPLVQFVSNQKSRANVYFSFIHSYINYGSNAWGNTYKIKSKRVFTYQKKAVRVIFFPDSLAHGKSLMLGMNALNVYQVNICQNLTLHYKAQVVRALLTFSNKYSKINYNYLTGSRNSGNYTIPKLTMKVTNFSISRTGPILWNTILDATLKEMESLALFKANAKDMLLSCDNKLSFF